MDKLGLCSLSNISKFQSTALISMVNEDRSKYWILRARWRIANTWTSITLYKKTSWPILKIKLSYINLILCSIICSIKFGIHFTNTSSKILSFKYVSICNRIQVQGARWPVHILDVLRYKCDVHHQTWMGIVVHAQKLWLDCTSEKQNILLQDDVAVQMDWTNRLNTRSSIRIPNIIPVHSITLQPSYRLCSRTLDRLKLVPGSHQMRACL